MTAALLLTYLAALAVAAWWFFIEPAILFASELWKGMRR